jgi:hypothetical protein
MKAVVLVTALAVAGGAGWWAGRTAFSAVNEEPADEAVRLVGTVVEGSVGETKTVAVTVSRLEVLVSLNYLEGTVNAVNSSGTVDLGETLFEVGGVPVRAVMCERPFYRDMVQGAQGNDVACLHQALAELGFLKKRDAKGNEFEATTTGAVKRWQKDLGIRQTGLVNLGELVAFAALPASFHLGESVELVRRLVGGEEAVFASVGEPRFEVLSGVEEGPAVGVEAELTVRTGDSRWLAVAGPSVFRQDEGFEQIVVPLTAPSGGVVCGDDCTEVPPGAMVSLFADVEVVPPVSGPSVPAAAVRTDTSGRAYVQLEDGERRDVEVLGAGRGVVVVSGLEVGQSVLLDDAATSQSAGSSGDEGVGSGQATEPAGFGSSDTGSVPAGQPPAGSPGPPGAGDDQAARTASGDGPADG